MSSTTADAAPASRKLPLGVKLSYGLGAVAYGIKDNGFSTLLLLFYNQVIGLPANLVGLALMVALILDAFVDPVIGHLSDSTRTSWGRRHPFMYAAALPVAALYLLLWNPPSGSQTTTLLYLIGVAILVRAAISMYEVPSSALAPELTSDYHERTSIVSVRSLFAWLGGMGMLLFTFTVLLRPTADYPVGQLNPQGYHVYAFYAAGFMMLSILASALGTHREIARLPKQPPAAKTSFVESLKGIGAALGNRGFIVLMAAGIFGYTNQGLNFALSTYFNTFLWEFPASVLGIFTICVLAGVVFAIWLAAFVSKLVGKRNAAAAFGLIYILIATAPYFLRIWGYFPPNHDPALLWILMITTTVATALGVASAILWVSMMSDVVELSQARTGKRTEGLFFAGSFFMQKCVSGLGLFLSGAILAWVSFPTGATPGQVSDDVLRNLALTYCSIELVFGIIFAGILCLFPISQRDHEERVRRLAEGAAGS